MERLLLDQLSQAERESFERHLFECRECAEELERLETIQTALRQVPVVVATRPLWRRRGIVPAVAAGVALVAAGLWLYVPRTTTIARGGRGPEPELPAPPALREPPRPPAVSPDLLELASIRAPAYDPNVLRGGAEDADTGFRTAMEAYRRSAYAAAIPGLRSAAQLAPRDPRPAFYLGACQLLVGDVDRGVTTLQGVVALGQTPYLEEAHLLLAKALVGLGEGDRARAELLAAIALRGDFEGEARRLLRALDDAPRGR